MKRLFLLALGLLGMQSAWSWGQKGHDVVAYIAECNLTPEAAERIDAVLDGRSMVYWANWLDNASNTPTYAYTKTWHYANIDQGKTFETMPRNPDGDVVWAVEKLVKDLRSGDLSPKKEAEALKMLIHLVGDMHCPMHAGHLSDRGGNEVEVSFFGHSTRLHTIWDSDLPEAAHRWSYSEWQAQLDRTTEDEAALIAAGEPVDWFLETYALCSDIYARTPAGTEVSYDYVAEAAPVIERQLLRGGYRLARLLNEIYR